MSKHELPIEFRSALSYRTRDDDPDDVAEAIASIAELRSAVEGLDGRIDTRMQSQLEALNGRLDELEAREQRPGRESDDEPTAYQRAFADYLRRGTNSVETRDLTVSNDAQGGYLAPAEMSTEFIRDLVEVSPIRSIASVRSIASPSVKYPKRTGITNAQWEGEGDTQTESNPTFGQAEVTARSLRTYVDLSNELLADSGGTAEAEVRLALADDFGAKEGAGFVNGDGLLAPEGFMTNADVAETLNGHATTLASDPLITLMYALPAEFRNRGTWCMNGSTLATVRKLKDGQGNYLWQPSFQAGAPETLLGRPVVEATDMPNIESGSYPIIFGDFSRAYRIVDRIAMSILVNPFSLATTGLTRIHATRRVGGRVIQAAAIRKLKMATS